MCESTSVYVVWHVASPVKVSTATAPQPGRVALEPANATVPPSGVGLTVAVKVTCRPNSDGSADDARVVAVAVAATVWVSGAELEPEKLGSPVYAAVTVRDPTST